MNIMDLLAQARPSSLDPGPDAGRRASDLAMAIGTPRAGTTARPGASRRRRVRRTPLVRVIAIGTGIAALAGTGGAVVALSATGTLAVRPQPSEARAGTPVTSPGELRNAILTAFNGVGGDVFYVRVTETYPGAMSRYNGVSGNWSYPLQPRAGQRAYARSLVSFSNRKDTSDTEWIYTEPAGDTQSGNTVYMTRTEMIDVEYGNRTWSDTTGSWGFPSVTAILQGLRESIANGMFTAVRKTELNGRIALEVTAHAGGRLDTWWVDPATYLPVRELSTDPGLTYQADYEFLQPTPANLAQLKVTIPAGFTRTATQELPG